VNTNRLTTCIAAVLSLLGTNALAESRVVHPGDDLKRAFANARPGDEFVLADGAWNDKTIELHAIGTAEAPVMLRAQSPGKVILTGRSALKFSGRHVVVSGLHFHNVIETSEVVQFRTSSKSLAEHCRLTNCEVTSDLPAAKDIEQKWVSIYGKHNRVDHSRFAGKKTAGTLLVVWVADGDNQHQIDHNYGSSGKSGG
jgi:poly(beta-D-mannuronate) lyase